MPASRPALRGSRPVAVGVVVLLLAATAGAWWFRGGRGGEGGVSEAADRRGPVATLATPASGRPSPETSSPRVDWADFRARSLSYRGLVLTVHRVVASQQAPAEVTGVPVTSPQPRFVYLELSARNRLTWTLPALAPHELRVVADGATSTALALLPALDEPVPAGGTRRGWVAFPNPSGRAPHTLELLLAGAGEAPDRLRLDGRPQPAALPRTVVPDGGFTLGLDGRRVEVALDRLVLTHRVLVDRDGSRVESEPARPGRLKVYVAFTATLPAEAGGPVEWPDDVLRVAVEGRIVPSGDGPSDHGVLQPGDVHQGYDVLDVPDHGEVELVWQTAAGVAHRVRLPLPASSPAPRTE